MQMTPFRIVDNNRERNLSVLVREYPEENEPAPKGEIGEGRK